MTMRYEYITRDHPTGSRDHTENTMRNESGQMSKVTTNSKKCGKMERESSIARNISGLF